MFFELRVTSLSGVTPKTYWFFVRASAAANFPQTEACDFRGQNTEAPPLPMNQGRSPSQATLSGCPRPIRQRLLRPSPVSPFGPFIVELFTVGFYSAHRRGGLFPGWSSSPTPSSRRWRTFTEPIDSSSRLPHRGGLWSCARGGISSRP